MCRVGQYDPDYGRNRILAKCFRRLGATVVDLPDPAPLPARGPRWLARALATRFDLLLVGFRAHADVPLARLLATVRKVPLVFDPLISRYEEKVIDRRLVRARSPLARWYQWTDRLGCRLADLVLLDTNAQIAYFSGTFNVPRSRFRRLWIGADDEIIAPRPRGGNDRFTVFFYGRFSPLHGIEHILSAARDLERRGVAAQFVLVGGGQTYEALRRLALDLRLQTVTFRDPVPYKELGVLMAQADVCLGIFGTTARVERVIPNKAFDALAAARPLVTADTPAVREALVHGEHAWFVPAGEGRALADALVALRDQAALRAHLAEQGHRLFQAQFSLAALARELEAIMEEVLAGRPRGKRPASGPGPV